MKCKYIMTFTLAKFLTKVSQTAKDVSRSESNVYTVSNSEIRKRTKVQNIGDRITKLETNWTWRIMRYGYDRWSKVTTKWLPNSGYRNVIHPAEIQVGRQDIRDVARRGWMKQAQNCGECQKLREPTTRSGSGSRAVNDYDNIIFSLSSRINLILPCYLKFSF